MADEARYFDVWITDLKKVYPNMPFTVVGDWITEGRLLEGDRVRPSGTTTWQRLADNPLLAPYLPKPASDRAEDKAEALEEIELDFSPKKKEAEDDDVDMIPLIDISMVLLVFFMMTAQNLLTTSPIDSPKAANTQMMDRNGIIHVGMKDAGGGRIEYYFKEDYKNSFGEQQFVNYLKEEVPKLRPPPRGAIVTAGGNLPFEKVQDITIELERLGVKSQGRVKAKAGGSQAEGAPQ